MYKKSDYSDLIGIEFLSERLLANHFNLYENYLNNTNHLLEHLKTEDDEVRFAELKRRFGWEWNGMRLHELYFSNLSVNPIEIDLAGPLHQHIATQFGSMENWQKEFFETAMMRGVGWVVLYYDKSQDKLMNCWIDEHDRGHLAGAAPIIVCDVFEHAYMLDYDINKKQYVESFLRHIDWNVAQDRFEKELE